MSANNLALTAKEQTQMLPDFDESLRFLLERRYLDIVNPEHLELATNPVNDDNYDYRTALRLIRLDEVSHEDKADVVLHLLNMQNVLAAIKNDSQNVVFIVRGMKEKSALYYGLSQRIDYPSDVSVHEYADVLRQTLHGNFMGVKMDQLSSDETFDEIVKPMQGYDKVRAFPGIPSLRLKDPNGPYVQGIDRVIEGLRGEEYCLVVIAEPISLPKLDGVMQNLFDLGTSIHSQVKSTVQKMKGSSDTVNVGMFGMSGDSTSTTISDADTTSKTTLGGGGVAQAAGTTAGAAGGKIIGAAIGSIVAPGVGTIVGSLVGGAFGALAGSVVAWGTGLPLSRMESSARSIANAVGRTTGFGGTGGYARSWNRSRAMTQEMLNKTAEHCENLCNAYIERLENGKNLGFWNVGVYLLTRKRYVHLRAQGLLRAMFSGDETHWEPIRSVELNPEAIDKYIMNFNNPRYSLFLYGTEKKSEELKEAVSFWKKLTGYASSVGKSAAEMLNLIEKNDNEAVRALEKIREQPGEASQEELEQAWKTIQRSELGHPFGDMMGGVSTPLNTEELSIIMNVPRREAQGVTIREAAPFGINYKPSRTGDDVTIGRVVHKRTEMADLPYMIPKNLFQKHAFVCGVTGSGKTNTCMTLLRKLDLPFMVVEPAKTEYRQMLNFMPDLQVFTLGSETVSPFRINPFEFARGSELLTHIDAIKAVFSAAFPMYASMPYILEEAIIGIYRDKGWDLATSGNRYLKDPGSEEFFDYLPTLQDLYDKIEPIVKSKAYAQEQTMNIQAALLARLSSLLIGSKGLMLNTRRSMPIAELLNRKVVLELKNIGDDDEKCFMMGLILSAIYQHRENSGGVGSKLSHILMIEEAHRLLRRTPEFVSPEIGNSRGKAVETFTNVISEIREYGQGVVIVDQIPSKLTEDVIKNTNIKIIHRTLAQDDRDSVGSTMNLTDAQSRELCLLEVGQAVIHREGADKAFLVKVEQSKDNLKNVANEEIAQRMSEFCSEHAHIFSRYPGFEKMDGIAGAYEKEDFQQYSGRAFFGVIGALTVMLTGDADALKSYKEQFNNILAREFRVKDDLRRACYLIYYANMFFAKLNESFPGSYDRCLRLQRLFIGAWFDGNGDAATMKTEMAEIAGIPSPLAVLLHKYIKEKAQDKAAYFRALPDENVDFARIEENLTVMLDDLLLTVRTSAWDNLMSKLLDVLLIENMRKDDIIGAFRAYAAQKR